MKKLEQQLLQTLKTIEGTGDFATSGAKGFIQPGLVVEGVGEIGLPLAAEQAKTIAAIAHKAPYGKGSQTITDASVRSAWEIDASQLRFRNPEWPKFLEGILETVQAGLGLENRKIKASLYKLLLYEPGDFFKTHKDSEKEKGMFGTLVVCLSSAHTGGEIVVQFDGKSKMVAFSADASNFNTPFVAFFADCDHEIKPVTSGHRLTLVYNLVQENGGATPLAGPKFSRQTGELADLLKKMEKSDDDAFPKAVVLGHQYTPENFSKNALKLHDKPRAEALLEAAEKAGFFARLGLVTHYMSGDLEMPDYNYRRRYKRGYYDEYEEPSGDGTMGEVYESYSTIEHWAADGLPNLGNLDVEEEQFILDFELGEGGDPIEKAEEGYTGNAGMTIEYWYHYGAVILWPKELHADLLAEAAPATALDWLGFYAANWEKADLQAPLYARQILENLLETDAETENKTRAWGEDCSPIARAISKLADEKMLDRCRQMLAQHFRFVGIEHWLDLLAKFPPEKIGKVFEAAAALKKLKTTKHLLDLLKTLGERLPSLPKPLRPFWEKQIDRVPGFLEGVSLAKKPVESHYSYLTENEAKREGTAIELLKTLFHLSQNRENNNDWLEKALAAATESLPRNYVNKVLAVAIEDPATKDGVLSQVLRQTCIEDLNSRVAAKPAPPPDWSREVPKSNRFAEVWGILRPFMGSLTQQVFDYRAAQSFRSEMESAIRNVKVDLKMETIRHGSPHTLRLTKTQAAFEAALRDWEEDLALLKSVNV